VATDANLSPPCNIHSDPFQSKERTEAKENRKEKAFGGNIAVMVLSVRTHAYALSAIRDVTPGSHSC